MRVNFHVVSLPIRLETSATVAEKVPVRAPRAAPWPPATRRAARPGTREHTARSARTAGRCARRRARSSSCLPTRRRSRCDAARAAPRWLNSLPWEHGIACERWVLCMARARGASRQCGARPQRKKQKKESVRAKRLFPPRAGARAQATGVTCNPSLSFKASLSNHAYGPRVEEIRRFGRPNQKPKPKAAGLFWGKEGGTFDRRAARVCACGAHGAQPASRRGSAEMWRATCSPRGRAVGRLGAATAATPALKHEIFCR